MAEPAFAILNEDGSCPAEDAEALSDEHVVRVLETMLQNRVVDRRFLALQRQGRIGFYMTSTGEEATTIGAAAALEPEDPIFLSYRELGSLLWRGVPLALLIHQLIGNDRDLCKGRQMPIHYCYAAYAIPSVSSPVGTQLPHATGYAYASKLRGTGRVALAFLGEGTASQGDFHTAVNFAGAFGVPAVFVIRNNGYAISTPESVQTAARSLAVRAEGYGVRGWTVDGNDYLAVRSALGEAARLARAGEGPTLIEALTYRMGAHSTADDPSAYREEAEAERFAKLDPLVRLGRHARWRGLWDDAREAELTARLDAELSAEVAACEVFPPPAVETLFEDVTAEPGRQLAGQRDAYLRFLARRGAEFEDVP